jgi:3-isopropylmalate/(R)-2-methylmalate dehydratase large subunit
MEPRSLLDKIWDSHLVAPEAADHPAVLYIDLHLVHEVTSPQAFDVLHRRGLNCRRPEKIFATIDHSTPTGAPGPDGSRPYKSEANRRQVERLEENCREHGIELHGWDSPQRGVVHVAGPESGRVHPGMTIVCGDSHTATLGAFGALAFGIGTTEVGHVLASQCLLQRKPKRMAVNVSGKLAPGVSAKDLILAIIANIGVHGGVGHAIEYQGAAINDLSMEGRMTLCNMSIEAGARTGMVAPDKKTASWVRQRSPITSGQEFGRQAKAWLQLRSDADAPFDKELAIDASSIAPMVTWGLNPGMAVGIDQSVPADNDAEARKALDYMGIEAGKPLLGMPVTMVFIGSCTNGRLPDLERAAEILDGRKVAPGLRMLVVPGSEQTKRDAEARGLDKIFRKAGAEWREAGCSMCLAMNGDVAAPGELVVSTSNRNFKGRQGPGARTILASPATAAAAAVEGRIADPRAYLESSHGG